MDLKSEAGDVIGTASGSRPVPLRALLFSLAALSVPVIWAVIYPDRAGDETGMLVWLTALVPAFLFTYYRGWQGASVAVAAGMAVLTSTHLFLVLAGISTPDWTLVLVVLLLFIGLCFGIGLLAELLHRERRAAEEMALTDPLTTLPNRRHAGVFLEAAFASAERGTPLSIVLFDLDAFKSFNDTYGHAAGDEILRTFARVLTGETRTMDVSARWGGEEFISVLSDSDGDGAIAFAERVRSALRREPVRWRPVTVSAGIATHRKGMASPELLVAAADRALYEAKAAGRDRIQIARAKPREEGEAAADSTAEGDRPRRPPSTEGIPERILLVEDDEDTRQALARSLRFHGYEVLEAPTGEQALDLVAGSRRPVDLVLTDIIMPGMSGFTLVDKVSGIQSDTPVLYMSGYAHDDVAWDGVPGARTAFHRKPMSIEELATRVRMMLDDPGEIPYRE